MTLIVLALTRYGPLGSSSRLRMLQYMPALKAAGVIVHTHAIFDDKTLSRRYERGGYGLATLVRSFLSRIACLRKHRNFDLVWVEKEALPWWPLWFEKRLLAGIPYALDFDDAVFHHYDQHRFKFIRTLFGNRIDGLMAGASLVICGNDYLAQRARQAGAVRVEQLPTVIDLDRYQHAATLTSKLPRIVWIGSPSTVKYLDLLKQPLRELSQKVPFVFRVIGGEAQIEGVQTECLSWSESTEVEQLGDCDIGVMPLTDTPWERGKCGYKLIQYMACRLPVVASPVGINCSIVKPQENGFLAITESDWVEHLHALLANRVLRVTLGQQGRKLVEQEYSLQVTAPRLVDLLRDTIRFS